MGPLEGERKVLSMAAPEAGGDEVPEKATEGNHASDGAEFTLSFIAEYALWGISVAPGKDRGLTAG